jgi:uncharacterized membrane protein YfcA
VTARLVSIGLVAGVFSTVFGVGGGLVIVPLLVAFAAFTPHAATATSLGAILLTATSGVVLYTLRGEVDVAYAALLGVPAMGGALVGAQLQQRISGRALTVAFSILLAGLAAWLIAA